MYPLSKSKLMSSLQCAKRLFLEVHQPELAHASGDLEARFASGHRVGEVAQSLYPEGRLIGHGDDPSLALQETQAALAVDGDLLLFEPAFRYGGVLVRADLLFRRGDRYRLVEVKATTSVKDHHLQDAAIQAGVIDGAGCPVDAVSIAHIDNTFVYPGGGDYRGLFTSSDVTEQVAELRAQAPSLALRCQQVLAGPLPEIPVGKQCNDPYACPFLSYCDRDAPEYPLSILGRGWRLKEYLTLQGYRDLREVPEVAIGGGRRRRVWDATLTGRPIVDPLAAVFLKDLEYPRYYLDFETISFAVPIWAGTRPYEQLPFQWSCSVEQQDGTVTHQEFVDTSGAAPMRLCAEALITALGTEGPVFAYTGFEGRVLRETAARYSDLAPSLNAVALRIIDLHGIASTYYYHPAQKGSWSLKAVLPTVAPELDYGNLKDVADGGGAQLAYLEVIAPETSVARKDELTRALHVYCRRDTDGMVRIAQFFLAAIQ
jgi:Domain of unknown function(DUF2779)